MTMELNKVQFLRTDVVGKKPTTEQCDKGELALNTKDRKIFTQDESGEIVELLGSIEERYARTLADRDEIQQANKSKYMYNGLLVPGNHSNIAGVNVSNGILAYGDYNKIYSNLVGFGRNSTHLTTSYSPANKPTMLINWLEVDFSQSNSPYDLTTIGVPEEHIGSAIVHLDHPPHIVDYRYVECSKYPDELIAATEHEAVMRAQEHLIINGDFRHGIFGWNNYSSDISMDRGRVVVSGNEANGRIEQYIDGEVGEYEFSVTLENISPLDGYEITVQFYSSTYGAVDIKVPTGVGYQTITRRRKFTSDPEAVYIIVRCGVGKVRIESAYIRKVTSEIITHGEVQYHIESWLEEITNDDNYTNVYYSNGNVQWKDSLDLDSIPLENVSDLGVPEGYTSFGLRHTTYRPDYKARKYNTLSDAEKIAVLSRKSNNIWWDAENKRLLQDRQRIMYSFHPKNLHTPLPALSSAHMSSPAGYVKAQGKRTTIPKLTQFVGSETYRGCEHVHHLHKWNNMYELDGSANYELSVDGYVHAIPLFIIGQSNQGAYHPEFNPYGRNAIWSTSGGDVTKWYTPLGQASLQSIRRCFLMNETPSVGYVVGGKHRASFEQLIHGVAAYGRSDLNPDLMSDAIYRLQVMDMLYPVKQRPISELGDQMTRQSLNNQLRSRGYQWFTKFHAIHSGYYYQSNNEHCSMKINPTTYWDLHNNGLPAGTPIMVWQPSTNSVAYGQVSGSNHHIRINPFVDNIARGFHSNPATYGFNAEDVLYICELRRTLTCSSEVFCTDIVGHPSTIHDIFPTGCVGRFNPVDIKANQDVVVPLHYPSANSEISYTQTSNHGSTWDNGKVTIDMARNTRTWRATNDVTDWVVLYEYLGHDMSIVLHSATEELWSNDVVTYTHNCHDDAGRVLSNSLMGVIGYNQDSASRKELTITEKIPYKSIDKVPMKHTIYEDRGFAGERGIKFHTTIIAVGRLLYLQYHTLDTIYHSDSWDDNGHFKVTYVPTHYTDMHGNMLRCVTYRSRLPIGLVNPLETPLNRRDN